MTVKLAYTAATAPVAAGAGETDKPVTRAELAYIAAVVGVLLAGALIAIFAIPAPAKDTVYVPATGVSIFAVFYIAAQVLERVLEPLASLYGTTTPPKTRQPASLADRPPRLLTRSRAERGREQAIVSGLNATTAESAQAAAAEAAWWDDVLAQIRANTTTLWAVASALGMVMAAGLNLRLLAVVNLTTAPRWTDVVVTGVAIGAGTKPLHDLIGNIQAAKESKQSG